MNYDNLTNDELIRVADGQAGLIKALAERLEMCMRDLEDMNAPTRKTPPADPNQLELF
jgi:malate synthase